MSSFKVNDMTCGHCEKAIKASLHKASESVRVEIDLATKILKVENLSDDQVVHVLKEIGYDVEKLK